MKKLTLMLFACSVVLASCKKDDEAEPEPTPVITAMPATFTQKVLVEEYTGAWCGYCVDGAYKLETFMKNYPGIVYGVSIHQGDGMQSPVWSNYDSTFNVGGFPEGMVNRIPNGGKPSFNRGSWSSAVNSAKAKTAKCGLALESRVSGTDVQVIVHVGFNQNLSGNYRLCVMIVEDNVSGTGSQFDQVNYYSKNNPSGPADTTGTHPYYNLPYKITGYKHKQVQRKYFSSTFSGDVIPSGEMVAGNEYIDTLTTSVSGFNTANCKIIAFVNKVGTTLTTHEIMNVQQVKLGSLKNWN